MIYRAVVVLIIYVVLFVWVCVAHARYKPEYENMPPEVREWYRNAELTPAARNRLNNWEKCCDHADVVDTQFRVSRENNTDEWWWLNEGKWEKVPNDIIHWGVPAPGGKPTLFVYQGTPTCFYPPEGLF